MKTLIILALTILTISSASFAVTIDGLNITGDFANATWKVYQDVADDWGGNNVIAMYIETNATHLLVGIPGYVNNNAVGLLLDLNAKTGSNVMPSGLTMSDSICAGMAGMSFDTNFTPDLAVAMRTADKASNDDAWSAFENINADLRTYIGTLNDIRDFGSAVTNGNTIFNYWQQITIRILHLVVVGLETLKMQSYEKYPGTIRVHLHVRCSQLEEFIQRHLIINWEP